MKTSHRLQKPDARVSAEENLSVRGDVAAWCASFGFHLSLLAILGIASFALPGREPKLLLQYDLPEPLVEDEPLPQEFLSAEEPSEEIGALSQDGTDAARAAALVLDESSQVVFEREPITDFGERMTIEQALPTSLGPEWTKEMSIQGAASAGTTGALGAIDRITHEIKVSVETRPTLVVWLFDQSGSLRNEREKIVKRFRQIYDELGVIQASNNPAFRREREKPLLTSVVGFGAAPELLLAKPTDRVELIEGAVRRIEDDATGEENVFQAVAKVAEKFRGFTRPKQGARHLMIVVFTDEAGDDIEFLGTAIHSCQKIGASVYVVGRPAPFGRKSAYVKWIDPDPKFDQRPQWVPVTMGPESLMLERLHLRFLGERGREPLLDSGYGPYGLTRLCTETGGIYFASHPNRTVGRRVSRGETSHLAAHFSRFFDEEVMRRYQPDYFPEQRYRQRLQENRARAALVTAAQMSRNVPLRPFHRHFFKENNAAFSALLSSAQRTAAECQPLLDRICKTLLTGESDRDKLRSPRWQAGYDLALGRALATKVRTEGYNLMLAKARRGIEFEQPKSNTWRIVSDPQFINSRVEQMAAKAQGLLEQVAKQHPGTPWSTLAERELREPLGWQWKETYTSSPQGSPTRQKLPPRRDPPPL